MKNKLIFCGMVLLFLVIGASPVFSQIANQAFSAVIREAESFVNGCGPADWPTFSKLLNSLNGSFSRSACNQHDLDYGTLGMSRSEADNRLYNALNLSAWNQAFLVGEAYWSALRLGGGGAYDSAQRQSRAEFKRIHHGNDWNGHGRNGRWHPSDGHVQMSFPQCVSSCAYNTR